MLFNSILDMIGNTPLLKLNNLVENNMADIYLKLEKTNPAGSVKDRAVLGMIEKAETEGLLKPGYTIVEPTSGNTGIALSLIGKLKGYNVIIVMPETMSIERRSLIKAYGAKLILTDGTKGMKGSIDKALELVKNNDKFFILNQFTNTANPNKHYETTAVEILNDLNNIDAFVAGVGTGGTITGVGKKLKEVNPKIKIVAVEPKYSSVLSGSSAGAHKIQGIGAGFIPEIYDSSIVDEIITITDEEAFSTTKEIAKIEGLLVGLSSGANIAASKIIAYKLGKGKKVVTLSPDGGNKYLSMGIFE
ncbi:cysteine synthase [Clostridium tepidiprofundi DSM 19306]|uniref:Cysteine synthase n=1 Tax=Clostridium tepidiprofundi DSM 19306 TaxID=1121338 RepID=A0A151ATM5_9CLOT|nr:cysteine synthase A [Clostridium tepidiprofundi]KYH30986.1 cysteine synthase [Clostridium tepidiprofundi DSM 19306]